MTLKDFLNMANKEKRRKDRIKAAQNIAVGMGIVATAGVATGILIAPKSGKETREGIKMKAVNTVETIKDKVQERADIIKDSAINAKQEVNNKIKDIKEKTEDVKKDIKDGYDEITEDVKDKTEEAKEKTEDVKKDIKDGYDEITKDINKTAKNISN